MPVAAAGSEAEQVPDAEPMMLPPHKRYPYAVLLSRVFKDDLGACAHCGGKLRFIACIDDKEVIARILAHLGLPNTLLKKAPARAPPQREMDDVDLEPSADDGGGVDDVDSVN